MEDWLPIISAVLAAIGLFFGGYQTLRLRRTTMDEQRLERNGVVVTWRPTSAPPSAEQDGTAVWNYEFVAHNPGRFPVDHVRVTLHFPREVSRLHADGSVDEPTSQLVMTTPVLVGGSERSWERRLRMAFDGHPGLEATRAEIAFADADGRPRVNRWPRVALRASSPDTVL